MANRRNALNALSKSRAIRDRSPRRLLAVAALSFVIASAGLVVAHSASAQANGAPAASSSMSPLQRAERDTDTDAKAAADAYKRYKAIGCTGTDEQVSDSKKQLKSANKQLDYTISNEAGAHPDVRAAEAAEASTLAQLNQQVANADNPDSDVKTARKMHKKAEKDFKKLKKEHEDQIRSVRLAGYAFGVPGPDCRKVPAATPSPAPAATPTPTPTATPTAETQGKNSGEMAREQPSNGSVVFLTD